jgi:nicotinamide phosphoribosyltransferase
MKTNPLLMTDGYKTSHRKMYPKGTTLVYSNYTCRSTKRMPNQAQDVVVFGTQYMIKHIHDLFQEHFFNKDKNIVLEEAKIYLSSYLGTDYDVSHFESLHDLGYLPIKLKSLEEGTVVKQGIPLFTIQNTHSDFFWVTNYLETLISTIIWKPIHSASLAFAYKKTLLKHAYETDSKNLGFVNFQGHDFSFRGMQSPEAAIVSAMGFLTSFFGTDTVPALKTLKEYYNTEHAGYSVPASEHSVMCSHGKEGEIDTLKYLMNEYPKGILSVVSDTWDLWKLITEYLPQLKEEIISRDGKLVIRPDSGDPVDIICGRNTSYDYQQYYKGDATLQEYNEENKTNYSESEMKGVIELLWDIFGGTINEQGYKVLDSHIGAIYGDSITLERADEICRRLKLKGFATTNIVLGIGSYSMGYATRDSQGGAVKSTYVEVNGVGREIFKDPITDDGTKKSLKGLLKVNDDLSVIDCCTKEEESKGLLQVIYEDGKFFNQTTLTEIREKIDSLCNETIRETVNI